MSFCSREDLASTEPMAGTGVRAGAYVFLPVPKRLWGTSEMNARWAAPEELAAIAAARKAGVVTRLYSPARKDEADRILVHAVANRPPPVALAPLLDAFAGRWKVEPAPASARLAICTHGTRDRCCAKWGFAAYAEALRLFKAGLSPFDPIECSHLGGDRYAATGVFFPSGSMYAHLDSVDLEMLTGREAAGLIQPETYRGRVFEPPLTQIARAGLARDGLYNHATRPLEVTRRSPEASEAVVSADGGRLRFHLDLGTIDVRFYASCTKLEEQRPSLGRRLIYLSGRAIEPAGL